MAAAPAERKTGGLRALILVGGYGTRLRPLTLSMPKPCVPFANVPMLLHQLRALAAVGVTDVVLAIAYEPSKMAAYVESWEKEVGINLHLSREVTPLGTGGPIALARDLLVPPSDPAAATRPFFVLNSDVVCDYPFTQMLEFLTARPQYNTIICVTQVADPSKFGVVVTEKERVVRFVEKPTEYVGNRINAGMYCMTPAAIAKIEARPTSIERDVFPALVEDAKVAAYDLAGFWADVGQPHDFVSALTPFFRHLRAADAAGRPVHERLAPTPADGAFRVEGNVLIHPTAKIGKGAVLGPDVAIGEGCEVGEGARLVRACVLARTVIGAHSVVIDSVVGWACRIGQWCRLDGLCVLGEDVSVADELWLHGASVLPNKVLNASVPKKETIM